MSIRLDKSCSVSSEFARYMNVLTNVVSETVNDNIYKQPNNKMSI